MKNFTHFLILTVVLGLSSWLLSMFLPWWIFAVVCFIGGLIAHQLGGITFFSGFLGVGIYYFISSFLKSKSDNFVFADKIGAILDSTSTIEITGFSLLCAGAFLFALLGGLFTLSGTLILSKESSLRLSSGRGRNREKSLKLDLKRYNR